MVYPAAHGLLGILPPLALLVFVGCTDQAKQSATHAAQDVQLLVALVDKDIAEVERGMPAGSERLTALAAGENVADKDLAALRKALFRVRREVPDLAIAKSTFFALADPEGIALRNDLEEDVMAGQNLFALFPALSAARTKYVATTGAFPSTGNKNAPAGKTEKADKDWVAAVPVRRQDGSLGAIFVTGWTYRYFARHLQESLKDRLVEQVKAAGTQGKLPVFYVAVFDVTGVYSAPLTPQVDEAALAAQDLPGKTAAGPAQGTVTITDRSFGWAAARTPRLAADTTQTGLVVLRSDL